MFRVAKTFFAGAAGATAGYLAVKICIGIVSLLFVVGGALLVWYYNRKRDGKRTPLFKDMTTEQYIGCVLIVIGLLPYIGYLFQGLLFSAGIDAGNDLMGAMFGNNNN